MPLSGLAPFPGHAREAAAGATTGFLYFVTVTGVTGARKALPAELAAQVSAVRSRKWNPRLQLRGYPERKRPLRLH